MSNLIWIGNTLYLRWVVFAVVLGVLLALAAFTSFMAEKTQ